MTQEAAPANPLEGTVPDSHAPQQPIEPVPEPGPEGEYPEGETPGAEAQPAPFGSIAGTSIADAFAVL